MPNKLKSHEKTWIHFSKKELQKARERSATGNYISLADYIRTALNYYNSLPSEFFDEREQENTVEC